MQDLPLHIPPPTVHVQVLLMEVLQLPREQVAQVLIYLYLGQQLKTGPLIPPLIILLQAITAYRSPMRMVASLP